MHSFPNDPGGRQAGTSSSTPARNSTAGTRAKVKGLGYRLRPGVPSGLCQESLLLHLLRPQQQEQRRATPGRQPGVALPRDRHRPAALRPEERERPSSPGSPVGTTAATCTSARTACLYISTGDGLQPETRPTPSTLGRTSAICSPPSSASTWIMKRRGKAYTVPPDNPFLKTPGSASGNLGVRLPQPVADEFRTGVTGDLWGWGDVGWELWEMIYRVQARRQLRLVRHGRPAAGAPGGRSAAPPPILPARARLPPTPRRPPSPAAMSTAASG